MKPKPGDIIVVWFSCGAASAVAAKETVRLYGDICTVRIVNNFIKEEDADNRRFLLDVQRWVGSEFWIAMNPKFPAGSCVEVWDKRQYMSGVKGAPCTLELKKEARYHFESQHHIDWHVMGFTADEVGRYRNFILTERPNTLPVLIDQGLTKESCFEIIQDAGIELPRVYRLGYPNANCIGCVKATSPTYWNHVRRVHPEVFNERAEQSRRIGAKLVRYKGSRIFLDELPPDAVGRSMRALKSIECGIFCEEKITKP